MPFRKSIPMRLRRAYLSLHRTAQKHFSQFGVTVDQHVVLALLADEEGLTQKELAARMCSDANTVAAMVRLLESKELIYRNRCAIDGRARRVYLTETGRRLQKRLRASEKQLQSVLPAIVGNCGGEPFLQCLDRIAEAMAETGESVASCSTNGGRFRRKPD